MIKRKHLGCGFWVSVLFLTFFLLSVVIGDRSSGAMTNVIFWSFCLIMSLLFALSRQKKEEKAAADADEAERASRLRAQQEADDARKKQHDTEQERLTRTLSHMVLSAREAVENLPSHISQAEAALDLAEEEFSDGAFAPFWDAVEKAVTSLASYDACVRTVADNSHRVTKDITKLDKPPRIEFPKATFPEAAPTLTRMARIVRQAQKDFHFATIYEQRRTNGILVAGFANLGRAIDDMGTRIRGSIADLAETLDSAIASMSRVHADQLDELISGMSTVREQLASDSEARRQHEGTMEGMLDNIQRRRKPQPEKFGDGKY